MLRLGLRAPWRSMLHVQRQYFASRALVDLPDKVDLVSAVPPPADDQPSDPLMPPRYANDIVQLPGSTFGGHVQVNWQQQPRTILIVKKPNDGATEKALVEMATWLKERYPGVNILVEPEIAGQFQRELPFVHALHKDQQHEYGRVVDYAITLGGDGTMLHLSSLFPKAVPPVVCFSMGTLGFLMSFQFANYTKILADMMRGECTVALRRRLFCSLHQHNGSRITVDGHEVGDRQVMNEVALHRGRYPHLTAIDCYVDNQYLTECIADGLIVSTPTGSTAYSLSAGGPIVHPSVQSLIMTPICPRSLSFRTVLLPPSSAIQLKIGESSQSQIEVTMDGQEVFLLEKGEYVQVRMSKYPVPCVTRTGHPQDGFAKDLNEVLKWNHRFQRS
ncbi:ATP-NAD kinase-like domain-containing protein [Gongronella butleri]|nr:ATP-NAD kinase-like domain-containing protein [Gongronella butleri]